MKVRIRYTETYKQVLAIIIIPLLYISLFTWLILSIEKGALAENLMNMLIMGGIILVIAASVFSIFKLIMEAGEAELNPEGLKITLKRSTFLFPFKELNIPFSNIVDASINTDPGKGDFINLITHSPKKNIMLFPEKYQGSDAFSAFWEALQFERRKAGNSTSASHGTLAMGKTFYQSPLVRSIAWISVAAAIVFFILFLVYPGIISGWKLLGFYCYAIPFAYLVFGKKT